MRFFIFRRSKDFDRDKSRAQIKGSPKSSMLTEKGEMYDKRRKKPPDKERGPRYRSAVPHLLFLACMKIWSMNSKTREKISRAANGEIDREMVRLVKEHFQAVGTREMGKTLGIQTRSSVTEQQ